jgi:hypothetical protein
VQHDVRHSQDGAYLRQQVGRRQEGLIR